MGTVSRETSRTGQPAEHVTDTIVIVDAPRAKRCHICGFDALIRLNGNDVGNGQVLIHWICILPAECIRRCQEAGAAAVEPQP